MSDDAAPRWLVGSRPSGDRVHGSANSFRDVVASTGRKGPLGEGQEVARGGSKGDGLKSPTNASSLTAEIHMSRSSSQTANNAVGSHDDVPRNPSSVAMTSSLNPSTQSFETTYKAGESVETFSGGGSTISHSNNMNTSTNSGESRIVCVSGVDPSTPEATILQQFECFGDIHSISLKDLTHAGYVVIVYHDIRAARLAMHSSGTQWRGRQLSCTMLDEGSGRSLYNTPMTTLYLVSLEERYGNADIMDDIFYLLSAYGELKELKRDVYSRPHCCLAEFYDSRHAAVAFQDLQSPERMGHRLLVLDARDVGAGGSLTGNVTFSPSSLPSVLPSGLSGNLMVHSASTPSSLPSYATVANSDASTMPPGYSKGVLGKYPLNPSNQHMSSQNMIDDVLTKNLSEISLESMHGFRYNGHASAAVQQQQSYPSLQQHALDQIWKEPAGSNTVSNVSSISVTDLRSQTHVSSPPSQSSLFSNMPQLGAPGIHGGHSNVIGGGHNGSHNGGQANQNMFAALQAQQRATLQVQQMQAQNNAAIQMALGGGVGVGGLGGGIGLIGQPAHQHTTLPQSVSKQFSRVGPAISPSTARRNHSDPALGGRLARNKMTPAAEAERKAHQDRIYGLNLNKIASGEDKRTTLMIKNIPNKYTQKMLLALLEERFAGVYPFPFDFFYLPIDFKNKCNVGYAFINMTTPHAIPALVEDFHGKRWPKFNSEKVCAISYGRIQGKLSLIQHFQNSSLLHEDKRCRPVLFDINGEVESFPIGPAALANFNLRQHALDLTRGGSSPSL